GGKRRGVRGGGASERNGEVEPEAQVGELARTTGCRGAGEIVGRQPALEDRVGELLVVAAEPRAEAGGVLHDGSLDLVEPMRPVRVTNHPENMFAPRLLGGQEVAHPARGVHWAGHAPILADASRGAFR